MKKSKTNNPVSKNMETFNRPATHRDKKNDYQRSTGKQKKSGSCLGYYDPWNGDYGCEYNSTVDCEDCKYGSCGGRKDPAAKCNQL